MNNTLTVDHVADFYKRYPGEHLTLFTRVKAQQSSPEFTLTIQVPETLIVGRYLASANLGEQVPEVAQVDGMQYLTWHLKHSVRRGEIFEFYTYTQLAENVAEKVLTSRAWITVGQETTSPAQESVQIMVGKQSRYLQFLPSIYADDVLMGRFLMLFESFWKPTSQKIDNIASYFDPNLTPPGFLPWLANWINLKLDERWPETKRRALLKMAAQLYRQRGTRAALQTYLEIYVGVRPQIIEHSSNNLRLGATARLGPSIALGTINKPHSFTVILRLPAIPADLPKAEQERLEQERQRTIVAIIEAEKPAHTTYTLRLETVDVARQDPETVAAL